MFLSAPCVYLARIGRMMEMSKITFGLRRHAAETVSNYLKKKERRRRK